MNNDSHKSVEEFLAKFTTVKPDDMLRDKILLESKKIWKTAPPSIIAFVYRIAAAFIFLAIALSIVSTSLEDRKMLLFIEANSVDFLKPSAEYLNMMKEVGIDNNRILIVSSLRIRNKTDSYSVERLGTYKNELKKLIMEDVKS